jgi:dimeric dUTPase (all-alpha-NTP-PPase superfamily)
MLKEAQARTMLDMQARMNEKVNPEWVKAAYPYLRAVVVEGAEAIEHHGWKWWKKQECDLQQLQMELVDIWHFTLSHILLEHSGDQDASMKALLAMRSTDTTVEFDQKIFEINELDTLKRLELTIGLACAGRVSMNLFEALLNDCKMSWSDLYSQYIGKNVLNFFRQDHGYKEGTYQKIWAGREDNEHLVDALSKLDVEHADFRHLLYESLKDRYQKAT